MRLMNTRARLAIGISAEASSGERESAAIVSKAFEGIELGIDSSGSVLAAGAGEESGSSEGAGRKSSRAKCSYGNPEVISASGQSRAGGLRVMRGSRGMAK
ncbi:hypothetical protein KM043_010896 [Ampulex compressa]|nr:hypothetical protein KM043_010896 [Ampulex compressa]